MKNELFSIGPLHIYGYGLMIAVGIIAAYFLAEYRAKKLGLNSDRVFGLIIWCVIGGILGSKLLYYTTQIKEVIANPKILLDVSNGFVVYGSIIGGIVSAVLYCKRKKISLWAYLDLLVPSVALAQGLGRIGCFLAGCCYGLPTDSPLGVIFTNSAYAPNGVRLIPTQLIFSGLNFLHFLVLILFAKRKKADGQVTGLYLMLYSIGRFILEFFRGDLERGNVGSLSTSQFIAIFMVLGGLGLFFGSLRGKKKDSE